MVYDCFFSQGQIVSAYTDAELKKSNPFALIYLGNEKHEEVRKQLQSYDYFVAIGDNKIRRKIIESLLPENGEPIIALHKSAMVSRNINCGYGVMIAPRVVVNSMASIGNGVILNSGCVIEHECNVGNFVHVAPGAVLCGNVIVGDNSLVGANSVIIPGVKIGSNVVIGAGSVITKNIPDNVKIAGNPAREV